MSHLLVSFIAALALSISTYSATGSLALSFVAYVLTGTLVLTMALLTGYLDNMNDD